MADLSQISASAVSRDSIIVSRECAVEMVHLAMLTEDRTEEEQAALLAFCAATDIVTQHTDYYVRDAIETRA